jgi:DNA-binding MarR family transcriptional regulator
MTTKHRQDQINQIESLFRQLTWRGRLRLSHRVEKYGLTVPQFLALTKIDHLGPEATMSEISDALMLPRSSMTSITDRLVEQGLVQRGTLENDRRAVSATITPTGAALVRAIESERTADLTRLLSGLDSNDLEELARLLAHLLGAMDQFAPDDG